ncbi:hypothetical protein CBR_g12404 [Chara braunii]|uniref:Right handed beta helix domain-containing protein n=1 Tax=Chara braunii TaxID=69332 RepID=A0A388KS18_CHABU|nr:hypothetical protein CBR_g12404 [Chara braunii]|eukprot:GBG72837.1 hypothetical protein CBR_g12404 [Chara braunii]
MHDACDDTVAGHGRAVGAKRCRAGTGGSGYSSSSDYHRGAASGRGVEGPQAVPVHFDIGRRSDGVSASLQKGLHAGGKMQGPKGKFRGFRSDGFYVGMSDIHFKNMCDTRTGDDYSDGTGAVAFAFNGKIRATRCVFESNKALTAGALAVRDSAILVSDFQFRNNRAVQLAGAIRVFSGGAGTVRRSVFSGNSAGMSGGAARVYQDGLNVVGCRFHGNSARNGDGGAVNFGGDSWSVISRSEFVGNSARNGSGGAVEVEGETAYDNINFCSCTFRGNNAKTRGSFNVDISADTQVTFCRNKPQGLRIVKPGKAGVNCTFCAKPVYWDNKESV